MVFPHPGVWQPHAFPRGIRSLRDYRAPDQPVAEDVSGLLM